MIITSLLLAISTTTSAATIDAWGFEDFGATGTSLVGDLGWTGGYSSDPWYSYDGWAYANTDDGVSAQDNPRYGRGTAQDNWVLYGSEIEDGRIEVNFYNYDDDTFGVILGHNNDDSFYMFVHSSDAAPPPATDGFRRGTAVLFRVSNGVGEVIEEQRFDHEDGVWNSLVFQQNDGTLIGLMNGEKLFEVKDDNPIGPGLAGMYAYNNGYQGGGEAAVVLNIAVRFLDDDEDGVADDLDNCEFEPNADQADQDGNGLGDACDPDYPIDTGGPIDTGDPVTDDTGGNSIIAPGGDITLIGQCGCTSGGVPSKSWGYLGLLGALFFRRRE